jgi:outer membrane cobalamin receptor
MKKIICRTITRVLAVIILMNPCPATAQDDITVLDTITVTDSGTRRKLLETNSAITVLTEKDIKNSGQTKTSELISSIPGVINQKTGSKTYLSIRGTRGTFTDGAVIYVDGRPANAGLYGYSKIDTIPLDNIEKIEVIKSPSSAEYGADSARGAILITTKSGLSADEPFKGYASAEYGSWNTHKLTTGIFGGKSDIDYSLAAYDMESDGYRQTDEKTRSADVQAGYRFDGGRVNLILGVNDSKIAHAAGLSPADVQKDRRANGYWAVSGTTAY